jgi:hypothetical protein
VVEISAKKHKGAGKKESWPEEFARILAEFYQKWQKRGRRIFSKEVPY